MEHANGIRKTLKVRFIMASIVIMLTLLISVATSAQDNRKVSKRAHRAYYGKKLSRMHRACSILKRKRNHIPRKSFFASNRKPRKQQQHLASTESVISINKSEVMASASEIRPTKKYPVTPKTETISKEKLESLHKKEDEVLAKNHLPVPTSQKHDEVRKHVTDKLSGKENVYPLQLAPLYFQFNQDEFSVVDMEPFLMAAEYALQGRTLLIEGHTDTRGQDDFNVKLSMKRVQKIRQLMLDMGVPDERISILGYGEEQGKGKSQTETDHDLNRRVDFTIF